MRGILLFFMSVNCSTIFGWYHHPSSGAQTTASTASAICHTVTAISRYRGRVGTGFSVLIAQKFGALHLHQKEFYLIK
jgi:hypothetical protein